MASRTGGQDVTIATNVYLVYLDKSTWAQVVNILTTIRFGSGIAICALSLLLDIPLVGESYFIVWIIIVLPTDAEGYIARKTGTATERGAAYDQIADGVFFAGIGLAVLKARDWVLDEITIPIIGLISYTVLVWLMRRSGWAEKSSGLAKWNIGFVALATLLWLCQQTFEWPAGVERTAIQMFHAAFIVSFIAFYFYARGEDI